MRRVRHDSYFIQEPEKYEVPRKFRGKKGKRLKKHKKWLLGNAQAMNSEVHSRDEANERVRELSEGLKQCQRDPDNQDARRIYNMARKALQGKLRRNKKNLLEIGIARKRRSERFGWGDCNRKHQQHRHKIVHKPKRMAGNVKYDPIDLDSARMAQVQEYMNMSHKERQQCNAMKDLKPKWWEKKLLREAQ